MCDSPGILARAPETSRCAASISRLLRQSSPGRRWRIDARRDYGEVRRIAVGRFASIVLTVIYTDRAASDGTPERRIISARVSKRRERKTYEQAYPEA